MDDFVKKFSARIFSERASDPAKELDSYEKRFDVKIPLRLRDIMIEVGGAIIFDKPVCFKPIEKSGWEDQDGLVGMPMIFGPTDDYGSLVKSTLAYMDQLPSGVFPFAELRGGNLLCYENITEKILFWDHEAAAEAKSLFAVARNFADFEAGLSVGRDEPPAASDAVLELF